MLLPTIKCRHVFTQSAQYFCLIFLTDFHKTHSIKLYRNPSSGSRADTFEWIDRQTYRWSYYALFMTMQKCLKRTKSGTMKISDATSCPGNSIGASPHLSNEMPLNTYFKFQKTI